MIVALLEKDLKLYVRNRLYSFLAVFGLLAYIGLYYLVPASGDEALGIGMVLQVPPEHPLVQAVVAVVEPTILDSREELLAWLEEGRLVAGLVLTPEILAELERSRPVRLPLYLAPGTPTYLQEALVDVLEVVVNDVVTGGRLQRIQSTEEVLGPDLVGASLSTRQRLLPLLFLFVLLVEVLGLAALVNQEIVADTAQALLVTPLGLSQLLTAKALLGVGLAVAQVGILLVATGQVLQAPLQVGLLVLLASLMVAGLAFIVAAVAQDYMGVFTWGIVLVVPLMLPGLLVLFPGIASRWMEWIPTFFLVDGLHRALNFQAPVAALGRDLAGLSAAGGASLLVGTTALRRRFR